MIEYNQNMPKKGRNSVLSFIQCACFKILDAFSIRRPAAQLSCSARPWAALALRLSGESTFEWEGQKIIAGPGSVLYLPSGAAFSRVSTEEELFILHLQCWEEENGRPEIFHPRDSAAAAHYFASICASWKQKAPGCAHHCAALLHSLLEEMAREGNSPLIPRKLSLIQPGVDYLESQYDDPGASVERAAAQCPMSVEYFRRLYKAAFGMPPHQALVEKRLNKACRLLQSSYFSVQEAATQSGFGDCKYFSALFHQKIGLSPREYKRLYSS